MEHDSHTWDERDSEAAADGDCGGNTVGNASTLVGVFESLETAKATISHRFSPLFGGDCFTLNAPSKLSFEATWTESGGTVKLSARSYEDFQYFKMESEAFTAAEVERRSHEGLPPMSAQGAEDWRLTYRRDPARYWGQRPALPPRDYMSWISYGSGSNTLEVTVQRMEFNVINHLKHNGRALGEVEQCGFAKAIMCGITGCAACQQNAAYALEDAARRAAKQAAKKEALARRTAA